MKLSIYITSYNQKDYLIEAIESVLNQTLLPQQIIIVDDYSSDGSQEVIAGYHSRYPELIVPIYHEQNKGVGQSRVDALETVTGDLITYLDGDDRLLPQKLEQEVALLSSSSKAELAFSNYYRIQHDGSRVGLSWPEDEIPPEGDIFPYVFSFQMGKKQHTFHMELVTYQAYQKVGFVDPRASPWEDADIRIRLSKHSLAVYNPNPVAEKREGIGGLSTSTFDVHLDALLWIYDKNRHLLDDLDISHRRNLKSKYGEFVAAYADAAVREQYKQSFNPEALAQRFICRVNALRYYLNYLRRWPNGNIRRDWPFKILLPHRIYSRLPS